MKYMGSKARFSKEILPIILKDRTADQWYVEPFAGGCNLICEVDGNRLANDINYYLMDYFLNATQNNFIPKESYTKDEYKFIQKNKDLKPYETGYVGICCSFGGKWFGRYAGVSETKQGSRNYIAEAFRNLQKQIPKLKGVQFKSGDYRDLKIPNNSIIYCDIPYCGTYSEIEGYSSKDFNHSAFWDWCREKANQGHTVFVSEYNAPADFECVWQKEAKSSLSANGVIGGNKLSVEKLFKFSPINV